ncbi:CFI-box-CTERM domain-containing protein [Candidatus Riflebacteria bacterium]
MEENNFIEEAAISEIYNEEELAEKVRVAFRQRKYSEVIHLFQPFPGPFFNYGKLQRFYLLSQFKLGKWENLVNGITQVKGIHYYNQAELDYLESKANEKILAPLVMEANKNWQMAIEVGKENFTEELTAQDGLSANKLRKIREKVKTYIQTALNKYNDVLRKDPFNQMALMGASTCIRDLGDKHADKQLKEKAFIVKRRYENIIRSFRNDLVKEIDDCIDTNQHPLATDLIYECQLFFPKFIEPYFCRIRLLEKEDKLEDIIYTAKQILQFDPENILAREALNSAANQLVGDLVIQAELKIELFTETLDHKDLDLMQAARDMLEKAERIAPNYTRVQETLRRYHAVMQSFTQKDRDRAEDIDSSEMHEENTEKMLKNDELVNGQNQENQCFIASAVFSPTHPYVQFLRNYRDQFLVRSLQGRIFIKLYIRVSPKLLPFIRAFPPLQSLLKKVITRYIFKLKRIDLNHGRKPGFKKNRAN